MNNGQRRNIPERSNRTTGRPFRSAGLASLAVLFAVSAAAVSGGQSQAPAADATSVPNAKCVIGLENFKPGAKGTISVQGGALRFENGDKKSAITIPAITDIFLGNESRQTVSGLGGTAMKAAIPYGGGRIVSLFSHKVEVMTVTFTDENGGFHGAVFVLPEGHATAMKNLLVAQGAKVSAHVEPPAPKEDKQ